MSKRAEQKALEAYPRSKEYAFSQRLIINDMRDGFIQGYEQAEKDLALTWEDIQTIDRIVVNMARNTDEPLRRQEEFYTDVLRRFNYKRETNGTPN